MITKPNFLFWIFSVTFLNFVTVCFGATFFVSPDGNADNNGSEAAPFGHPNQALDKAKGGDVIIVKPGTYLGLISLRKSFSGTQGQPSIIKSSIKWKATIMGGIPYNFWVAQDANWIIVDGFELLGAQSDGIKVNGSYCTVQNCWVHNNSGQGISMDTVVNGAILSNLVESNGFHVQFHHGIYVGGSNVNINGNIIRNNAGFGMHLYPLLSNSIIANNVVYGHANKPGLILAGSPSLGNNLIINNTIINNLGCISFWDGINNKLYNNILISKDNVDPIELVQNPNVFFDYNFCSPKSQCHGQHDLTDAPTFVDPDKGVYWLASNSPAIGKGLADYVPATNFWGITRFKIKSPDLGAYEYISYLTTPDARATWYCEWPYTWTVNNLLVSPDLWSLPSSVIVPKDAAK